MKFFSNFLTLFKGEKIVTSSEVHATQSAYMDQVSEVINEKVSDLLVAQKEQVFSISEEVENRVKLQLEERQKLEEERMKAKVEEQTQLALLNEQETQQVNLLSLPFHEASNPEKFALHIEKENKKELYNSLLQYANPAMKVAFRTADFVIRGKQVVISGNLPKGTQWMVSKAGPKLTKIVSKSSGEIVKTPQLAGSGAKVAACGPAIALALIEVCHMVSAHEQVKHLRKLTSRLDTISHYMDCKLHAELESIYRHAKEILSGDTTKLSAETISEISQLCLKLMSIRANWRNRYFFDLDKISPAKSSKSSVVLRYNKGSSLEKSIEEREKEFFETSEAVHWMHFSLNLQMVLSQYTGRLEQFLTTTIQDELHDWSRLAEVTKKNAKRVTKKEELSGAWKQSVERLESVQKVWTVARNNYLESAGEELSLEVNNFNESETVKAS